jgi:nicotinamide-nucleotide amidase
MQCEIIAVGSELLLGQLVDTNSTWISKQLAAAGIESYFQTRVDDHLDRIAQVLRTALSRSDAVIVCGGLGPTQDDISREAIAQIMAVPLLPDPVIAARIQELFRSRGRRMPENNLRQAEVPQGATVMPQMPGTAPGLICPLQGKVIYAVPGVPWEMRKMVAGTVIPDLRCRAGTPMTIKSRTLKTWGASESRVAELLSDRVNELAAKGNPKLAFQASGIEGIKVRVTAMGAEEVAVDRLLREEESHLRGILGDLVFAADDETMESIIIELLREKGFSLGVAESLTGGMVGARLTAVPGASDVFRGAVVAYASDIKYALLGVPEGPVVSESTAKAMAQGVRKVLQADIGLATTGVAGPSGQEGQPIGRVYLGLAISGKSEAHQLYLPGERQQIRQFSVISLLNILRKQLLNMV